MFYFAKKCALPIIKISLIETRRSNLVPTPRRTILTVTTTPLLMEAGTFESVSNFISYMIAVVVVFFFNVVYTNYARQKQIHGHRVNSSGYARWWDCGYDIREK